MPMLETFAERCVGWMTLFTSTVAGGGWVERHPTYGVAPLARESTPAGIGVAR
jgi:hypothetical protein